MREICTSGSTRGSDGKGVAYNSRPSLSTLPGKRLDHGDTVTQRVITVKRYCLVRHIPSGCFPDFFTHNFAKEPF